MIKRHFFLVAAIAVLAIMVVAGAFKVIALKSGGAGGPGGPGGGGPPGAMAAGPGGPGGAGGGRPGGGGGRRGQAGIPAVVTTTGVAPRTFQDTIEVLGVAKGRQSVTLTAAATQLVERVRFQDGQRVPRGAILVELKNTEQDAGVAQAQARLTQAQRAYERYRTLGEQGYASKAAIDQYESAYRAAQADVAAARAREADRLIRAPFSGVVGLSDVAPGALVNPGAPIVTLDDLSAVRVDFQVPERYIAQLRAGQPILATVDAFPGETITGRIAKLDTRVDERTRAMTARAEFPNADGRLKPGMMLRVGISRGQRTSLAAPETAVSVQGESAFVYIARQQQGPNGPRTVAEQRVVVTGARQQNFVEIREGVRAGERIVADGLNKIQPGQTLRVVGAGGPGMRGPGGGPMNKGAGMQQRPGGGPPPGGRQASGEGARPQAPRPAA